MTRVSNSRLLGTEVLADKPPASGTTRTKGTAGSVPTAKEIGTEWLIPVS